jgi:hypothetical protein
MDYAIMYYAIKGIMLRWETRLKLRILSRTPISSLEKPSNYIGIRVQNACLL